MNDYIVKALRSFLNDPAKGRYQRGYLAALYNAYVENSLTGLSIADLQSLVNQLSAQQARKGA